MHNNKFKIRKQTQKFWVHAPLTPFKFTNSNAPLSIFLFNRILYAYGIKYYKKGAIEFHYNNYINVDNYL